MSLVQRANTAYLRRHPWQLALSVLGIAIGVAVIVAVDLANASARKAFLLSMDAVTGEVTHQIIGGPRGVADSVYRDLKRQHGLDTIAPVVDGDVLIDGRRFRVLGTDAFAELAMRSNRTELDASGDVGNFLVTPNAAFLSRSSAASLNLGVGDTFTVIAGEREITATLLGVFGSDYDSPIDDILSVDIATAKDWLNMPESLSRIDARLEDADAIAALKALLPPETTLLDADTRSRATLDLSAAFMTNLQAMSLLALLVGLFLIYNSVSFSVLQRRSLLANLRALGVSRSAVLRLVLIEAAVIGAFASIAGLLLGLWIGDFLLDLVARSINDLYFRVSVTGLSVETFTLAKGVLAGILTALVAAFAPALEAASCQPRLGLQRSGLEGRAGSAVPRIAAGGVGLMLLSGLVLALSGESLTAGLVAVFMLILGFALCIPLCVRILSAWLAPAAASAGGLPLKLAISGIGRSLSRTGVAIVALAVAVSATIGVSVMVDSFRASVSDWLGQALQADFYIGAQRGSLPDGLDARLADISGIAAITTSRQARLEDENGVFEVLAIDMHRDAYRGTEIIAGDADTAWSDWESADVVFVSEPFAWKNRVTIGDDLSLRTDSGERPFRIAAVYRSYDVSASGAMMNRSTYDRYFDDTAIDGIGLYVDENADIESVEAAVRAALPDSAQMASNRDLRSLSLSIFDRTFVITDVLYWLATGVAIIGILSSMLALQLENAREQGTLRALGMTRLQLGGLVTAQTGAIGLISGLAALPLGAVMAWVLITIINRRAFGWQIDLLFQPMVAVTAVLLAVTAAVAAGLYPASRAARSQPATAMREE